jgi:DNA-3-methyladenine glycosylase II
MLEGRPSLLEIRQPAESTFLEASSRPVASAGAVSRIAAKVTNAAQDLRPFYAATADHSVLGPLTTSLRGLKAFRPTTLFEMLVIAVIEQQISLMAAHHIRERIVHRFGVAVDGLTVFPSVDALAEASREELMECGVSGRKSEYIGDLARMAASGTVDLEAWETLPDEEIRERVTALRGFGRWSADYLLVRGLGRPDAVPVDDLGIQTLVGKVMGYERRLSAEELQAALEPFAPFRGLAVFYLLVGSRLSII